MVADMHARKDFGIGQRRKNPVPDRGSHIDDALNAVGEHDGEAGVWQGRDADRTIHSAKINARCPEVRQGTAAECRGYIWRRPIAAA